MVVLSRLFLSRVRRRSTNFLLGLVQALRVHAIWRILEHLDQGKCTNNSHSSDAASATNGELPCLRQATLLDHLDRVGLPKLVLIFPNVFRIRRYGARPMLGWLYVK